MTHAAVLHTEQPDLQALFDEDWASGKYRRPKCSKADYYAGWLVAYERFRTVMATEKVAIVEKPAQPARASQPKVVKEKYEQEMLVCNGEWLPACELARRKGATDSKYFNVHEQHCHTGRDSHPAVEGPRRDGEILHRYESLCGCEPHNKLVTRYVGGLPLKRISPIKAMRPVEHPAIPDSMIRKLAIMAGRPEIAP